MPSSREFHSPPSSRPSRTRRRLFLTIAAIALVVAGGLRLRFDADVLGVLPGDLPEVQAVRHYTDHFAQRDELIVTIEGGDAEQVESATRSLADHLRSDPGLVRDVNIEPAWESAADDSSAELPAYLLLNRPVNEVRGLVDRLAPDRIAGTLDEAMSEIESGFDLGAVFLAGYDPLGLARAAFPESLIDQGIGSASEFVSEDGRFRVAYARAPELGDDYRKAIAWVERMRQSLEAWRATNPDEAGQVDVRFTGDPAFAAEISSSMQSDMQRSGLLTLILIGGIFLACYRRFRPMLALTGMLVLVFFLTLVGSSLFLGGLTVITAGFASILIGLTVDYGLILYQRALAGEASTASLRRGATPGIAWAALTTAAAFLALSASHFPGLAELGKLVAFGIALGAVVMLWLFAPMAAGLARGSTVNAPTLPLWRSPRSSAMAAGIAGAVVLGVAAGLPIKGPPPMSPAENTLRPRHSEAYAALETLTARLGAREDPLQVLVRSSSLPHLRDSLRRIEELAADPERNHGTLAGGFVPTQFIPAPSQSDNLAVLAALADDEPRLRAALDTAGFTEEAFAVAAGMIHHWKTWQDTPDNSDSFIFPASTDASRLVRRIVSLDRDDGHHYALAILEPAPGVGPARVMEVIDTARDGNSEIFAVSWDLLSDRISSAVRSDLGRTSILLAVGIGLMVAAAFRSLLECALTVVVVALNLVALLGAMAWLGLSWNFVNLGALLLALGAGLDYSIHLLLALRENQGDVAAAHRQTGFALLICAASTVAGFGSLALASNLGLASLGQVCALALALNALISLFILPWIWHLARRRGRFALPAEGGSLQKS